MDHHNSNSPSCILHVCDDPAKEGRRRSKYVFKKALKPNDDSEYFSCAVSGKKTTVSSVIGDKVLAFMKSNKQSTVSQENNHQISEHQFIQAWTTEHKSFSVVGRKIRLADQFKRRHCGNESHPDTGKVDA